MSERNNLQKVAFLKLLGVVLIAGGSAGTSLVAKATSLNQSVSSLALSKSNLAQAVPAGGDQLNDEDVPFSELNEALSAARSRLTELTKAAEIAKVVGELREKLQIAETENQQLKSVLGQLQTDFSNLQFEKQQSDGRVGELEEASELAAAEAGRLNEELLATRQQNSQLSSELALSQTAERETSEELTKAQNEVSAREEGLIAAANQSVSEITRLQRELDAANQQTLNAEALQARNTIELAELRQIVEDSTAENAKLAKDLDGTITELVNAQTRLRTTEEALEDSRIALNNAEQEAGVLKEQLASNQSDNELLQGQFQSAQIDIEKLQLLNSGLERQVAILKTAAGEATNAARQNLVAVEDQISEINAALASVTAEDLLSGSGQQPIDIGDILSLTSEASAQTVPEDDSWVPRPPPARASIKEQGQTAAEPASQILAQTVPILQSSLPDNGSTSQAPVIKVAELAPDLPTGAAPAVQRKNAAALLSGLKALNAVKGKDGLSMTVPGKLLFAVDSEQINPAAFDPLENVAKLVNLYDERDVLIIGHTDAVGDANYNQLLSERRASLVKKFFVEKFQVNAERMQIEGRGELEPIETNATADGRDANRRIEVLILD